MYKSILKRLFTLFVTVFFHKNLKGLDENVPLSNMKKTNNFLKSSQFCGTMYVYGYGSGTRAHIFCKRQINNISPNLM